jgi:hypothetical protein
MSESAVRTLATVFENMGGMPNPPITAGALDGVREQVQSLPDSFASAMLLECALRDPKPVDVSLHIDPQSDSGAARDLLATWNDPAWRGIRAVAQAWREAGTVLNRYVSSLWLEFDSTHPIPNVFVGVKHMPTFYGSSVRAYRELTDTVLNALFSTNALSGTRDQLYQCYDNLPDGSSLRWIGVMLPRDTDAVRLCIRGMRDRDMPGYAQRNGWNGDLTKLQALHDLIAGHTDHRDLAVDVGASGIGARIGIEGLNIGFNVAAQDRALLSALVAQGLSTRAEREALLAMPRTYTARNGYTYTRSINHIKVLLADSEISAKVYLRISWSSVDQ